MSCLQGHDMLLIGCLNVLCKQYLGEWNASLKVGSGGWCVVVVCIQSLTGDQWLAL